MIAFLKILTLFLKKLTKNLRKLTHFLKSYTLSAPINNKIVQKHFPVCIDAKKIVSLQPLTE